MTTSSQVFLEGSRDALALGAELAAGGEGVVYELPHSPGKLAKLFHTADHSRERKLRAMVAMPALRAYSRLAWPQQLLVDSRGIVRGYTMRRLEGVSLVPLTAEILRRRRLPRWTLAHTVRVCHDLACLCEQLESNGVYIADLSLLNFLVDPRTAEVSGIDCDSYSVCSTTHRFPSLVYTTDFQVPEILDGRVPMANFGPAQFRGAAASLFFALLTVGGQPYACREGLTIEETITQGRWIVGGKGVARGCTNDAVWRRYMSLPPRTCALFKRAFIGGHQQPASRPSFAEWQAAMSAHYRDLLRSN